MNLNIQNINNQVKSDISDDFIGIFDHAFSKEYCDEWIRRFDEADKNGLSYNRMQGFNKNPHVISDQAVDLSDSKFYYNTDMNFQCLDFNKIFWGTCYEQYTQKFSILKDAAMHKVYSVKIQRTLPKEGYHAWHFEDMERAYSNRILTFILYLNDVEEGGETEFLYLSKRVKCKTGRIVIWPAGFTHTHRGNPPLKETKYIVTGWVEF